MGNGGLGWATGTGASLARARMSGARMSGARKSRR